MDRVGSVLVRVAYLRGWCASMGVFLRGKRAGMIYVGGVSGRLVCAVWVGRVVCCINCVVAWVT